MTTPTPKSVKALADLADRVESATGPDRLLDRWCALAMQDWKTGMFKSAEAWIDASVKYNWNAPAFTASLDAAMKLVPSTWIFEVGTRHNGNAIAQLFPAVRGYENRIVIGGATPALALTAAALRAHAHLGASHE